jgi:Ca2+-binding RTX toxin-like protein
VVAVLGALLVIGMSLLSAGKTLAASATLTIAPATPSTSTSGNPFGWVAWTPFAGHVYKNLPPFELRQGDTLAFDAVAVNELPPQIQIEIARTANNGGDAAGEQFRTVVTNTQTSASPAGNTIVGDYDLAFKVEPSAPYSFPGGGMIMRFSNPSAAYMADTTLTGITRGASATDPSGFFVKRFFLDADGNSPYTPGDSAGGIAGFRLSSGATCRGQRATIIGTQGADQLQGTAGLDVIVSFEGDDQVFGLGGKDVVCGGAGNDKEAGGPGKDDLSGEAGRDKLKGGAGKDKLRGGAAKDVLRGGKGRDLLKGGAGKDSERQ